MSLEKLGPYRFKGVLGRGGMGTVYRGEHEDTGEFHAVKVLAPTYTDDDHFRGRFESEIKALLKLNHPNIVQLLSYGQKDGMLFFSMELIEGNSLFQMQRQGHRFDWRQILAIAQDVCQGLRHAHDRGVIHRDLKPGNLLMATDVNTKSNRIINGMVKITDFGIAKSYGSSQNTGTNVLGTMDFMSPEQARGEPTTFRSDLYSLGTVMFTLLSGKPPFASKSVEESILNLTKVPAPQVSSVVPGVPRELDAVIQKLMEKRPEKRIPTALALGRILDELESAYRDHAEAKTAEFSDLTISENTFELFDEAAGSATTDVDTDKQRKRNANATNRVQRQTAEYSDHDLDQIQRKSDIGPTKPRLNKPGDARDDYFNTVTDHLRNQQDNVDHDIEKDAYTGKLPLVVALLSVIGLTAFGLYKVLTPPTANQLYSAIVAEEQDPVDVLKEIDQFLKHYPNESRAVQVAQLRDIGEAIQFYNLMQARSNMRGIQRLSNMEQQFLQIIELAESNSTQANQKMAAFVTFHSSGEKLSESDQKVLEHAKAFRAKIRNDARNSVEKEVKQIRSAMETAAKLSNRQEAMRIYESILELYQNVPWGKEAWGLEGKRLVEEARQLLGES